eukprot:SAG25_NODE_1090_length_4042_cov_1.648237_2_plen_93_part_00
MCLQAGVVSAPPADSEEVADLDEDEPSFASLWTSGTKYARIHYDFLVLRCVHGVGQFSQHAITGTCLLGLSMVKSKVMDTSRAMEQLRQGVC